MKQNQINEKYRALFKKVSNYYNKVIKGYDIDDVHNFRVEIKKLKAFIRLINLVTPDKRHRLPGNLKSFYNVTGSIRNLELHQRRVKNLCEDLLIEKPEYYLKEISEQERYWKKIAKQFEEDISLKDFEMKLAQDAPEKIEEEGVNVFMAKYKSEMEHLITLRFYFDETLYEIRRYLKDIMYNWDYVQSAACILLPGEWHELKNIESITARLGDFQDLCITVQLLHLHHPTEINIDENEALKKLELQLGWRKADVKLEIMNALSPIKRQLQNEKSLLQVHELL